MKPKPTTPSVISACLLALLVAPAFGQAPDPLEQMKQSPEYKKAYKLGADEADREIKDEVATLYTYGLHSSSDTLDRETGLPYRGIANCAVDDKILGRLDGHNDRIAELIKKNGPLANSLKKWENEIADPKAYFEAKARSEKPVSLDFRPRRRITHGPALKSPDGKATIRPTRILVERMDRMIDVPAIAVRVDGVDRETIPIELAEGELTMAWGPEGSGFVVVRSRKDGKSGYLALDLRRGLVVGWSYDS